MDTTSVTGTEKLINPYTDNGDQIQIECRHMVVDNDGNEVTEYTQT